MPQHDRILLPSNIDEAIGDIGSTGENERLDPGADCRHRGSGVIAAIDQGRKTGLRHGLPRGGDQCAEPARPSIVPGCWRAREDDGAISLSRGAHRRDRVRERVNDDYRRILDVLHEIASSLRSSQ